MTNKITQKIIGYSVKMSDVRINNPIENTIETMHENIKRDDELHGKTYKIKIPTSEHAIYVTTNSMQLDGMYYPYEVFINCKDTSNHQWITALTRLISAVMRKGGNVRFIADELMQVADPNGGHWTKKGANGEKPRFMPSLTAEIGYCLLKYFDYIDSLNSALESEKWPVLIKEMEPTQTDEEEVKYPDNASICPECKTKACILMDGCKVCLSCGASKCS